MVVTCPKCSTSYEFDETLIGPKGTVVRCTQCSHMFKIFADDGGDPIEHAGWMIRKLGGKVFGIDRFSTIQKWIREGKIDAEDSLSRTGKSWKKLGEIVELQGLFSSLGSTKAAVAPTPPAAGMDLPPRLSVQDGDPQEEPSGASPALAATTPAGSEPSGVARQKLEVRYDAPEPEAGTVKGPLARSLAPEVSAEEEKEDRLLMPDYRPGRWKRWLVLAIVLLVIGLGIGGYLKRDLLFGWYTGLTAPATEGEHDKALERAHEYFLLDTDSYFDQAEKIYRDLLAKDDHDTGARVGLAELLSVRAQYARDRREILGLTKGVEDAGTLTREARKVAQLAVLASPDSLEANRALADALRLSGDLEGARKHLDKALDIDPRNPETLYVATLLDFDEGRELDRVIKDLERILGRAEALIRVRYRLALLHALAGDKESSRSEAEKILEMNTDHDLASSLVKLLEQGAIRPLEELEPEPEPEPEQVEEAVAEADVEQPEELEVPPQETEGKKVAGEPAGTSSGVPMGKSYDYYIGKAVKYRSGGDCDRALDYFEKALQIRPSSVEALSGSAYCHMSMYQYGPAMAEFKRALKSNKNYGPALIGLAQAMEKKGNIKGAVEYYKKYLDSHSSGAQAGLARNKIKELEDTIGPGDKPALDESGEGGEDTSAPEVPKKVEEEVEIKGSVGQPSGDTPTTAGDPYD